MKKIIKKNVSSNMFGKVFSQFSTNGLLKQIILITIVTICFVGINSCSDKNVNNTKDGNTLQEEKENSLVGEWYEVNSTETEGTKVVFTKTNMSIYGFRVTDNTHIDTLMYAKELGYKILSDNELEFDYRPPVYTEFPNYKVNYTFKSVDTLFIEKIWANNIASVYPLILDDILLCRRK